MNTNTNINEVSTEVAVLMADADGTPVLQSFQTEQYVPCEVAGYRTSFQRYRTTEKTKETVLENWAIFVPVQAIPNNASNELGSYLQEYINVVQDKLIRSIMAAQESVDHPMEFTVELVDMKAILEFLGQENERKQVTIAMMLDWFVSDDTQSELIGAYLNYKNVAPDAPEAEELVKKVIASCKDTFTKLMGKGYKPQSSALVIYETLLGECSDSPAKDALISKVDAIKADEVKFNANNLG